MALCRAPRSWRSGPRRLAAGKYDFGASDAEIKLGNTNPYSGPASGYTTIGRTIDAYFKMVNERGGINGRKVTFLTLDDGYQPPKTVEQDQVAALFQVLGTPTNTAIHKYANGKKVPHLFVATGATKWGDPQSFPWTMGWQPSYQSEMQVMGHYIAKTLPGKKIAALWQNDDAGKDHMLGLKQGLGEQAKNIVVEPSYEPTDPTVDSQILQMKSSGAQVMYVSAIPKFVAPSWRSTTRRASWRTAATPMATRWRRPWSRC